MADVARGVIRGSQIVFWIVDDIEELSRKLPIRRNLVDEKTTATAYECMTVE